MVSELLVETMASLLLDLVTFFVAAPEILATIEEQMKVHITVADLEFLRGGGANRKDGGASLLFCPIFPKNCMKMKKFGSANALLWKSMEDTNKFVKVLFGWIYRFIRSNEITYCRRPISYRHSNRCHTDWRRWNWVQQPAPRVQSTSTCSSG